LNRSFKQTPDDDKTKKAILASHGPHVIANRLRIVRQLEMAMEKEGEV
jgi:hypothetical protein